MSAPFYALLLPRCLDPRLLLPLPRRWTEEALDLVEPPEIKPRAHKDSGEVEEDVRPHDT